MTGKILILVCAGLELTSTSYAIPSYSSQLPSSSTPVPVVGLSSRISVPATVAGLSSDTSFSSGISVHAPVADLSPGISVPTPVAGLPSDSGSSSGLLGVHSGFETGSVSVPASNRPEISTSLLPVIQAPSVTLPTSEKPLITLESDPIPAPRVIAHKCICTKTIVRPQVYQRTVTVPKIQRYLRRTVTPVVKNISYKSIPISQPSSRSRSRYGSVIVSSGPSFRSLQSGLMSASHPLLSPDLDFPAFDCCRFSTLTFIQSIINENH